MELPEIDANPNLKDPQKSKISRDNSASEVSEGDTQHDIPQVPRQDVSPLFSRWRQVSDLRVEKPVVLFLELSEIASAPYMVHGPRAGMTSDARVSGPRQVPVGIRHR
jgi:hypothetical protein